MGDPVADSEGNTSNKKAITAPEPTYNPFEHRDVKKPTSDFGALVHMIKTSLGSGILAMPMAFKNAGLALGSAGTVTIGLISTHCIYMLIRSSQVLCKRNEVPILSFSETMVKAFENGPVSAKRCAKCMGILVTVQLLGSFILGNSVYVVFVAQSLSQVVEFFWHPGIDVRFFMLMLWLPLVAMCMIRDLRTLVPFSIIANLLVVVSFGVVLYYIFRTIEFPQGADLVSPASKWPLFMSTIIFAIEGIGVVMTIENEMRHPEHFISGRCPIAFLAMGIVVTVYAIVGFFGYLEYGEETMGSITLNLPIKDKLGQTVKILIALAVFFTYALQFYVPINIVYNLLKDRIKPKYHLLWSISVRAGLVTLTIIISLTIPKLELIITFVGAISFSVLGLLMPALIDTMTRYPNFGRCRWHLTKNVLISILSLASMLSGTYSGLLVIIKNKV